MLIIGISTGIRCSKNSRYSCNIDTVVLVKMLVALVFRLLLARVFLGVGLGSSRYLGLRVSCVCLNGLQDCGSFNEEVQWDSRSSWRNRSFILSGFCVCAFVILLGDRDQHWNNRVARNFGLQTFPKDISERSIYFIINL